MKIACKKGCFHCCLGSAQFPVPKIEAERVAEALRDAPGAPHPHPHACPALGMDGSCRAHAVRPSVCRATFSSDVRFCLNPAGRPQRLMIHKKTLAQEAPGERVDLKLFLRAALRVPS